MSIKEDVEKVQKKIETMESQSFAMEMLEDYKRSNKRLFVLIIIILVMWFATIGYLVYVLKSIDYVDETSTIDIEEVENIDNSHIKIGDDIWEKSK